MATTHYVWDPFEDNVIEECDENGDTIVEYETEPDPYGNLISQDRDGVASYYHFDGQGSTLALTSSNGDVTDEYRYNAFGETTERAGSTENCRQYVGEKGYQYDAELDTYDVRERDYSPTIGRWLSVDPLGVDDDATAYRYAFNNPMLHIDASGQVPCKLSVVCSVLHHCGVCVEFVKGKQTCYHGQPSNDFSVLLVNTVGHLKGDFEPNVLPVLQDTAWSHTYLDMAVCGCIITYYSRYIGQKDWLKYSPYAVGGCNSNFIAGCAMRHCGITDGRVHPLVAPLGWEGCGDVLFETTFFGACVPSPYGVDCPR